MKTLHRFLAVLAAVLLAGLAFSAAAQSNEPTVAQIYQAANSGNLDRANAMIEQVLQAHPNSARAHYVKAELAARGRNLDVARQELATAEKIAPGLPFAKPESVQALRNQIANTASPPTTAPTSNATQQARRMGAPPDAGGAPRAQEPAQGGFPWGTLIVVGAVVGIGAMLLRRRQRAMESAAAMSPGAQAGYGPGPGYYTPGSQQPYPPGYPPQQPSMGSSLARGAATGLAIGAGALAAQEIGRRMFDHGNANAASLPPDTGNPPTLDQIDEGMRRNLNTDMGGDNFGISDAGGGWDDGGGGDGGGGGDW